MYSGYMGRDYYDMETVIKAASRLQAENILFILRGFGGDPVKIRQTIEDYNVKNVELRTEVLPKDQAISVMKMADIFLLPMSLVLATDWGLPTKVLEYQALGKPIICISKGEPGRYIMKTQSGLLMKSNDPEILAELIMKLLNDNNLAYRLGKNGLDYVSNNLTLEKIGERLMKIIHKVNQKS
jgi:glycosyltransferase involved in cell wall biosynthesis